MTTTRSAPGKTQGFLMRLMRDQRAATMPMLAAAVIPLAGLIGGSLDMSRIYLAKARLQQACDAGALAGRKRMGGGQWAQASYAPKKVAETFFETNYTKGSYGTAKLKKDFTENAGKVTGTASVEVPMSLMKIFNYDKMELEVTCDAEMRLPNTDVMFVLDVTGSMGSKAVSSDTQTKIQTLRSSVKCFYEILARLDTPENCSGGAPTGGTGSETQIRFGFVPYATNVNVGRLLPTGYLADKWPYQTRQAVMRDRTDYVFPSENGTPGVTSTTEENFKEVGTITSTVYKNVKSDADCQAKKPADDAAVPTAPESAPYDQQSSTSGTSRSATWKTRQPYRIQNNYRADLDGKTCTVIKRTTTHDLVRTYGRVDTGKTVVVQVFDRWRYAKYDMDVSGLKSGSAWNAGTSAPIGDTSDGSETIASKSMSWDGCIEERATVRQSAYSPVPAGAKDLDIDLVPTSDATTKWGPLLPEMLYYRGNFSANPRAPTYEPVESKSNLATPSSLGTYSCPVQARKLQTWPTPSAFTTYVDSLAVGGNTYHDIGMIWGARLMSPTGIFGSENATTPQGGEIERHLIFMTDGEACTNEYNYQAYGVSWYDRRQTSESTAPTSGCLQTGTLTQQVNARLAGICSAVKNKNITVWTIFFDQNKPYAEQVLRDCATPGRFFTARNSVELQATFRSIADQISQLRLTQ